MGQKDIIKDIRKRIVEGDIGPGKRLPGHRELVEKYSSTMTTVQKSMEHLIEQGFVESFPRRGRFVAEHPPHSSRVALAFPGHPDEISDYRWTRYLAAIWASAQRLSEDEGWDLVPYFDIDPTDDGRLTRGYEALMEDIRADRVAGVIFCYSPHNLSDTELLQDRPVPMVGLFGGHWHGGPTIMVDQHAVLDRSVAHLMEHNRRRLAWVLIMKQDPEWLRPELERLDEKYGFYTPKRWIHPMDQFHPQWVRHSLSVMLEVPPQERPDGLIVMDDHLVGPVVEAVRNLGIEVPGELEIVGYWNFPLKYTGPLPVHRIGQDTQEQLQVALEVLRKAKSGELKNLLKSIQPISEEEFVARYGTEEEVGYQNQNFREEMVHVN